MKFVFSNHALEQMHLRHITKSIVEKALVNPLEIIESDGKKIFHSIVLMENKKYLIRIFVNHKKTPNVIITVYKTSKISKYYET